MPHFTPTQSRILEALADGRPHMREELQELAGMDPMIERSTFCSHLTHLRGKLRPIGQDILYVTHGRRALGYQLVRLMGDAYE